MKSVFFALVFLLVGVPLVFGEEMVAWTEPPITGAITINDFQGESYFADPLMIIKYTPPSTRFEGDILWSEGIALHECVKFSPYTKECVTQIHWQFGLKKDGTVVWREVEGK